MIQVEDDGSYQCVDVSDEVSSDYVSRDGDSMTGSLEIGDSLQVDKGSSGEHAVFGTGSHELNYLRLRDSSHGGIIGYQDDGDIFGSGIFIQTSTDADKDFEIRGTDDEPGEGPGFFAIEGDTGDAEFSSNLEVSGDVTGSDIIDSEQISSDAVAESELDTSDVDGRYVNRDGDSMSGELSLEQGLSVEGSTDHSYNGIRSTTSNSGHLMLDSNSGNAYINWEDDGDVYLAGGGGDVDLMDGSGSVGVGTRSPSYQLDVRGDARFTDDVNMDGNDIEDVSRMNVEDGFQVPVGEDAW